MKRWYYVDRKSKTVFITSEPREFGEYIEFLGSTDNPNHKLAVGHMLKGDRGYKILFQNPPINDQ